MTLVGGLDDDESDLRHKNKDTTEGEYGWKCNVEEFKFIYSLTLPGPENFTT